MTDAQMTPIACTRPCGCLRDQRRCGSCCAALRAIGVADDHIAIGLEPDIVASFRGEMHDEVTNAFVVPNAAFIGTKESIKGIRSSVLDPAAHLRG